MNKGYTLIEMLAVFVVLAILAIISFPVITDTIKEIRESGAKAQEKLVIEGAKGWVNDHNILLSDEVGSVYEVSVSTLNEEGYLSHEKLNKIVKNEEYQNSCVKITTLEHKYSYEFKSEC